MVTGPLITEPQALGFRPKESSLDSLQAQGSRPTHALATAFRVILGLGEKLGPELGTESPSI